jgi:UDP-N-acetylmuramyl pentapeptide synthase
MAKKKEDAGKPQASRRQAAGKLQATRRKVQEEAKEAVKELLKNAKSLDICIVFAEGDNIDMIAKQLTGHSYMAFKVCEYSGVKYQDVRPGTVLKWPMR